MSDVNNDPSKVSAFLEFTVNLGQYSSVKVMGGLSRPLDPNLDSDVQLTALTKEVASTLAPFVEEYKKQRVDDPPKAGGRGGYRWGANSRAAQSGAAKPMSTRTNAPAPSGPPAQAEDLGDGNFAVTVSVDKVWPGRVSQRSGKLGPGTIVASSGEKYDTFDKGDIKVASDAMQRGQRLNIIYKIDENFGKPIIDHRAGGGVSIFGETEADETSNEDNY